MTSAKCLFSWGKFTVKVTLSWEASLDAKGYSIRLEVPSKKVRDLGEAIGKYNIITATT